MGRSKPSQLNLKTEWKIFGSRIPPELAKAVRILSVTKEISVQDLMIEALNDVLVKHGEKLLKKTVIMKQNK